MKVINYSFLFFALFFWIEGCASKNAPIETRNLSSDTPVPIYTQETTLPTQPFEETPFNTQEVSTLIQPSGKVVYDLSYLQDCRLQYSTKNDRQVGFRNMYPGITTVPDMLAQFGQPNETSGNDQGQIIIYTTTRKQATYITFAQKNNIIEDMFDR